MYLEVNAGAVDITVFQSSLKSPLATALSIDEAYMDTFQVHDIDNGK